MKLSILLALSASWLAGAGFATAGVLVVDDDGGPGVTHTQIAAAVAAAADGDFILVKAGTYASFTFSAKSLSIVADDGAVVTVQGYVGVSGLASTQRAHLRGLRIAGPNGLQQPYNPPPELAGCLQLANNAGIVEAEDCTLTGSDACVLASNSTVNLVRVDATPIDAHFLGFGFAQAGVGLDATGCSLAIDRCTFRGGKGYNTNNGNGNGGAGAVIAQSTAYAVGSTCAGGKGTDAGYIGLGLCMNGGNGGAGLAASGATTLIRIAATALVGGAGGKASPPMPIACAAGVEGPPSQLSGATLIDTQLATSRGLTVTSPKRVGQVVTLTFTGVAGDQVFLFWGPTPQQAAFPIYDHSLLATPATLVALGAAPSATWVVPAVLGPIGGALSHTVYAQGAVVDANGAVVLGGPSTIIALDPSL